MNIIKIWIMSKKYNHRTAQSYEKYNNYTKLAKKNGFERAFFFAIIYFCNMELCII